jgi:putative copper resistance protein D
MALLVDLFGYLSIILHGLVIVAQSMALGGVVFLVFLARPRAWMLGTVGEAIAADTAVLAAWSAVGLAVAELITVLMQAAVLTATVDIGWADALGAQFAIAGLLKLAFSLFLAAVLFARGAAVPSAICLLLGAGILAAATMTTHAAARVDHVPLLLAITALHQLGAAIWIGGIPSFVRALSRVQGAVRWRIVGERFSLLSSIGVGCIVVSATGLAWFYIGDLPGAYGTAYGVMAGAKAAMFLFLLGLGYGNFRAIRALRPGGDGNRLKRFAEVEIGIGFTLFFAAASLTSVPPAVDLTLDRVTFAEIVARNAPVWPRFASPDYDTLAIPALQAQIDAEAAAEAKHPAPAFIPGAGELPVRNAADIAWSEYNHHWSGVLVLAIALLALANRAGLRAARHWPLLFLVMAVFLFFRSDPETWPLGEISFLDSMRDVEVVQHRFFDLLIVLFGVFEWRVRAFDVRTGWQPYVFPLVTAVGSAALLTHSHAIANVKDQLLIELTHTPLALAGVAGAWARWLELRLDGRGARIAGWVWPMCFLIVGLTLLIYREA